MNYKYVILDFGKVIAKPSSGDWDITPKFLELIDINKINKEKWKELRAKYGSILSEKVTNLAEEYNMFLRFYGSILSRCFSKSFLLVINFPSAYVGVQSLLS